MEVGGWGVMHSYFTGNYKTHLHVRRGGGGAKKGGVLYNLSVRNRGDWGIANSGFGRGLARSFDFCD